MSAIWKNKLSNKRNIKPKKGMAIVIVLCFSALLLAYGTLHMGQYKDSTPVSKLQLDRIQADFFAKGIQNLVLFKIKKVPGFFLKSYRQYMWGKRKDITDDKMKLTEEQKSKAPFDGYFMRDKIFGAGGKTYWSPLKLDYYEVGLKLLNSEDFHNETIEITVDIRFAGRTAINKYVAVVNGNMDKS